MKNPMPIALFIGAFAALLSMPSVAPALKGKPKPPLYGERYCDLPGFHCLRIGKGRVERELKPGEAGDPEVVEIRRPSWQNLWPDPRERELVMKLNRMNIRLKPGMRISVPADMAGKTYMDFSPFPERRDPRCDPVGAEICRLECASDQAGEPVFNSVCERECELGEEYSITADGSVLMEKLIIVDLAQLAFAAYDERGELVRWGPVSGGRDWGPRVDPRNLTVVGEFRITRKLGRWAESWLYAVATEDEPARGTPVPYFMRFYPGYGLHAYHIVPGRHDSHGCVRLFFDDAKWLNLEFAEVGTRVIVLPYE